MRYRRTYAVNKRKIKKWVKKDAKGGIPLMELREISIVLDRVLIHIYIDYSKE